MKELSLPLEFPLPSRDWYVSSTDKRKKLWASRKWTREERCKAEEARSKSRVVMTTPSFNSLEQYISVVNNLPMLNPERELMLARKFRDEGDLEAAREIVTAYLRYVVFVARGYFGYNLPPEELIQEGNIGLMKALKRYDPERGVRFVTFAVHWIKASIHEFIIQNWRLVRVATTKPQRKLFFNLRKLKGEKTLTPTAIDQIAAELKVNKRDVIEMEQRLKSEHLPLEPLGDEEDFNYPISTLADPDEPSALVEAAQLRQLKAERFAEALAALDQRSRQIIEARWLTDERSVTLTSLSKRFKVSPERIRQIEIKAIQKLRDHAKTLSL